MKCPSCNQDVMPDRFFCNWCDTFMPAPGSGKKAGLGRRFFAVLLDALFSNLAIGLGALISLVAATSSRSPSALPLLPLFLFLLAYLVLQFYFWSKGTSPGKRLLGVQVVEAPGGSNADFWRMLLREVIGKWVSSLILGLGYFWAIWDKDGQAWHDKIAGTLVVKQFAHAAASRTTISASATLELETGRGQGRIVPLRKREMSIGRSEDNDIVVADNEISRRHAVIKRAGDRYFIQDLNSTNGTLLNGRRVTSSLLENGDELKMGSIRMTFRMWPGR